MNFDFLKIFLAGAKIFLFISLGLLLFGPAPEAEAAWKLPELQINIPGVQFGGAEACPDDPDKICVPWIGNYVFGIYKYAIGLVGILATVVMMWGGVVWITAAGSTERIASAKAWISASLAGLVLALTSYTILYTINPDLVKFKPLKIEMLKEITPATAQRKQPASCDWAKFPCSSGKQNVVTQLNIAGSSVCVNEDKTLDSLICCCNFGTDYSYDVYIYSQMNDADTSLKTLLNCMKAELPAGVGRISSVSDSDKDGKSLFTTCRDNYSSSVCEHTQNSCHYGGSTKAGGSQAVDFGDEEYGTIIKRAADKCGAGYILDEGNHIHISSSACSNK